VLAGDLARPRDPAIREIGSGFPVRGTSVKIVDQRIFIAGPTLFDGYERDDGSVNPARTADGFFDTGDVGVIDAEGRLHVHARGGDLIVTGGENVYRSRSSTRSKRSPACVARSSSVSPMIVG